MLLYKMLVPIWFVAKSAQKLKLIVVIVVETFEKIL